jgi:hypothetical protein
MSKSFSREAKTHTHSTEQLEMGKKLVSVEKGGGELIFHCGVVACVHIHTLSRGLQTRSSV